MGGLRVEGRVEIDEVDAFVGDVVAEDVEVVAVEEDVGFYLGVMIAFSLIRSLWGR